MCLELGRPAVIVSGNDPDALPDPYRGIPYVQKPFEDSQLVAAAVKALRECLCHSASEGPM
jgi:hypothetical protein